MSFIINGFSRYLDFRDAQALGFSSGIWLTIGLIVFFLSILSLFTTYRKQQKRLEAKINELNTQQQKVDMFSGIQFFEQRESKVWEDKVASSRNIWAMYLIGGATLNNETPKSANFTKLILLHPDNEAIKAIKEMESGKSVQQLQQIIRDLTALAQHNNCKVYWCHAIAYSLLTIGNSPKEIDDPPPNDMWVYVETYVPGIEARKRPGFLVDRSKNPELADRMLVSFKKLLAHSIEAPIYKNSIA